MLKIIINIFKKIFYILILIILVLFCWFNWESLAQIKQVPAINLLLIIFFYSLLHLSNAFCSYYLLKRRGYAAKFFDMFVINSYSSVLGYASFFRAGFYASKLYFYKKLYDVPLSYTLGIISYISVVVIASNVIIGLLAGVISLKVLNESIPASYWIILIASSSLVIGLVVSLFSQSIFNLFPIRIQSWINNFRLAFTSSNPKELAILFAMISATVFFHAIALRWLLLGFSLELPFIYYIFMAIFSNLSLIIAITPSNLGIKEILIVFLLAHLDVTMVEIVSVLLVDRVLQFLMVSVFSLSGYRNLKRALADPV